MSGEEEEDLGAGDARLAEVHLGIDGDPLGELGCHETPGAIADPATTAPLRRALDDLAAQSGLAA